MKCPTCEGEGGWTEWFEFGLPSAYYECPQCKETGSIPAKEWVIHWLWNNLPVEIIEWVSERSYKKWLDTKEEED